MPNFTGVSLPPTSTARKTNTTTSISSSRTDWLRTPIWIVIGIGTLRIYSAAERTSDSIQTKGSWRATGELVNGGTGERTLAGPRSPAPSCPRSPVRQLPLFTSSPVHQFASSHLRFSLATQSRSASRDCAFSRCCFPHRVAPIVNVPSL